MRPKTCRNEVDACQIFRILGRNCLPMFARICLLLLLVALPVALLSQGHLLLVGGNSETEGGWSDLPYAWAAARAPNHRVAVIGTGSASQWLPDYFMSLGASYARNVMVATRAQADAPSLADTLATYDCLFFRGGDQWTYIDTYQGTRLDSVVRAVYQQGGVIGGTSAGLAILSGVDFTAENGTVYPEEMLADWANPYATLDDGFLPLLPGYLFDSHFVERGRFARLAGWMAHWQLTRGQRIHGIGVDDKTALCIYPDGLALAYGTAAVNCYFDDRAAAGFASSGTKPTTPALRVVQLLDGDSLHLSSGAIGGLETTVQLRTARERRRATLLMSGSDRLSDQHDMLQHLVRVVGNANDSILVISASPAGVAANVANLLASIDSAGVVSVLATQASQSDLAVARQIATAQLLVLAGNDPAALRTFLTAGPNGQRLRARLHASGARVALVGDDARLAGPVYLANYRQPFASYDGLLDRQPGLGLLHSSIVMPHSFLADDVYENTASGLPWAMVQDSLAYGLWLSQGMWAKYFVADDSTRLISYGARPLLLLANTATRTDLAGFWGGFQRNVVGFDDMTLRMLDSTALTLGLADSLPVAPPDTTPADTTPTRLGAAAGLRLEVAPNPSADLIEVRWSSASPPAARWELLTLAGRRIRAGRLTQDARTVRLSLGYLPAGAYWLRLLDTQGRLLGQRQLWRQ